MSIKLTLQDAKWSPGVKTGINVNDGKAEAGAEWRTVTSAMPEAYSGVASIPGQWDYGYCFRSQLKFTTGNFNNKKYSKLIVKAKLSQNGSPKYSVAVLTKTEVYPTFYQYGGEYNASGIALTAATIEESYAYADENKNQYAGTNLSSGNEFYYIFDSCDFEPNTTYYIYIRRGYPPNNYIGNPIGYNNGDSEMGWIAFQPSQMELTLYETPTYTVTFNANGGEKPNPETITKYYNSEIGNLPTTTRTGYTFDGWYTAASGGIRVAISTKVTKNVTYYAQWLINSYTFTLGSCTGASTAGSTKSGSKNYGTTITLKATANTGYTWSKWISSNTNLVANKTAANTTFSMPAGDITMTPSVTANTYSIKYDGNGHTGGSMLNSSHTYNASKALNANSFIKLGYKFIGWATTPTGKVTYTDKQSVKNLSSTNGAIVTLYAVWKPEGLVNIYTGITWEKFIPYIFDGAEWVLVLPYIYIDNKWELFGK